MCLHIILMIDILFLLSLLMLCTHGRSDPLQTICSNTTIYTLNSPFESNLKQLLFSLPSKTSLSGFYNTSIGKDPDTVYGLALCRGDVTSKKCLNCIRSASLGIMEKCPNSKDATIFYELCQVRYSFKNFFSEMIYAGMYINENSGKQNTSDAERFVENLKELLSALSSQAAFGRSKIMFATKEASVTPTNIKIYGLAQCTNDISTDDCMTCLQNTAGDMSGICCEGGIVLSNSCNMRYELYRFYGERRRNRSKIAIFTSVPICVVIIFMGSCFYCVRGRKVSHKEDEKSQPVLLHDLNPIITDLLPTNMQGGNQMDNQDLPLMDLATIKVATNNFSDSNKLGQGGFGTVYKGTLPDGKEIAVKRLSRRSWQGLEEFKNEIKLIAKLQHRNLVRLLGCGIDGEEKVLIYEFMPNRSLDAFIFDPTRRSQLNWQTRFNIIIGIGRGLLYLHEDSRLKIIHRDLKPNNVLLDNEMNAKISDFGMARIFGENQSEASTRRVVGTHGYMAPEYAMEGLFSVKSDVFSFGVVLLEIVSGKRSNGFYITEHAQTLISYAWHLWKEGKGLDFVEQLLMESCPTEELLRCIHIGLLCVQEDATYRPTMSSVLVMLGSQWMDLPQPAQPAFSVGRIVAQSGQSSTAMRCSVNEATISSVAPR